VECGPGEILLKGAIACLSDKEQGMWLPSMLENCSAWQTLSQGMEQLQT